MSCAPGGVRGQIDFAWNSLQERVESGSEERPSEST